MRQLQVVIETCNVRLKEAVWTFYSLSPLLKMITKEFSWFFELPLLFLIFIRRDGAVLSAEARTD